MTDLPAHPKTFTVARIAKAVDGEVEGDASLELEAVLGLAEAGPAHLSFLANRRYFRQLEASRAGCVLLDRNTQVAGRTVIRCRDPYVAFAKALQLFHPQPWPEPSIDPRAVVATDAKVDGSTIEAFVWVGRGAEIGAGSWLEAGCYVGARARIGRRCRLMAHAVVAEGCELGDRVWLNPGAVVGSEGFGFAPDAAGHVKIPQIARARVADDVEIGANSCIDRGTLSDTVIGQHTKMDNLVQVGHGARIGNGSLLAGQAAVAGSTRLGQGVILAGRAGVINHLEVGDGSQVSVGSIVMEDQPAASQVAGTPAIERRRWLRAVKAFASLPELLRRVRALESRVAELEESTEPGARNERT